MTDKDILEKAIQKAWVAGWRGEDIIIYEGTEHSPVSLAEDLFEHDRYKAIIFSHDFAKSIWGENDLQFVKMYSGGLAFNAGWKHHLQQMVIADDPIKYLGEHL